MRMRMYSCAQVANQLTKWEGQDTKTEYEKSLCGKLTAVYALVKLEGVASGTS